MAIAETIHQLPWLWRRIYAAAIRRPAGHLPGFALRYWLRRPHTRNGWSIRLVHLHGTDPIPYCHDLPAFTIVYVLHGAFCEVREHHSSGELLWADVVDRKKGNLLWRSSSFRGRLELNSAGAEALLLVFSAPRKQELSYYTEFGKVRPQQFRG